MSSTRQDERYAYSEHVSAGPRTREHISPVTDEGLRLGGGAPAALCWRGRWSGWHLGRFVTAQNLDESAEFVCEKCAEAWREVT